MGFFGNKRDGMLAQVGEQINAAQEAEAFAKANNATQNGYAGPIKNNEAPQMDLMSQLRTFQQYKGAQNKLGQQPQSTNPYQQMQDSRYQQALSQPAVSMPAQPAQPRQLGLGGK